MVGVERDRWGRYVLEGRAWTRVTTFARVLADGQALGRWRERMVVEGLGLRPDLVALAAAHPGDREVLGRVAEDAVEAARGAAGANVGTALHAMSVRVDAGERVPDGPWAADLRAYERVLREARISVFPEWTERVVLVDELGVAGTFDRIVEVGGERFIADLKTTRSLDFGWLEIAVQLACYSHASAMWDVGRQCRVQMPGVSRERALVIHVPAGRGVCELWWVDVAAGWEAARVAVEVRRWRAHNAWSRPFVPAAVGKRDVVAVAGLAGRVPVDGGVPAERGVVPVEVDDGPVVPVSAVVDVRAQAAGLGGVARERVARWGREQRRAGVDLRLDVEPRFRCLLVAQVMVVLAQLDEGVADRLVSELVGVDVWDGVVLAGLSSDVLSALVERGCELIGGQ